MSPEAAAARIGLGQATRVWVEVAALSFGGPAAQIGVMHRMLVDERRWISPSRFQHALNFCMLLPGPEAMQLATYIGWLMHGPAGGLIAGGLFILPGIVAIMALSAMYAAFGTVCAGAAPGQQGGGGQRVDVRDGWVGFAGEAGRGGGRTARTRGLAPPVIDSDVD